MHWFTLTFEYCCDHRAKRSQILSTLKDCSFHPDYCHSGSMQEVYLKYIRSGKIYGFVQNQRDLVAKLNDWNSDLHAWIGDGAASEWSSSKTAVTVNLGNKRGKTSLRQLGLELK